MAGFGEWIRRLLGGGQGPDSGSSAAPAPEPRSEPTAFAEGHIDFALATYRALGQYRGNLVFSPFSMRAALAMAQVGARGETAAQMSAVLRTSSFDESADVLLGATIPRPNAASGGKYEMAVANSLWCQDGAPLQSAFLDLAVLHKARVEVNEEGTEAAAATAVLMTLGATPGRSRPQPIPVVRADHSFLFAIRDRSSGGVLFLGRLTDPTREG